ncbi:hypothetical protein N7486_005685 [Penicillium sp. IBT 16267x]|nr:hypothetical protein N7486_005685 [Penicillium sp. IBT 16267x]
MDDFNSSEIEFEPSIDKRNNRIGQKSIDAIIAHAPEDRISSKRRLKQLQFGHGAPGTRMHQDLWVRRFQTYREHALGKDPTIPFTGAEIIRFVHSIIDKVKPKGHGKPAPNETTITEAFKNLLSYGHFTWNEKDGFKITQQDRIKLTTFIHEAVREGRLIRGTWNKRTWIGFVTLSRMVRGYLEHCLTKGCLTWDFGGRQPWKSIWKTEVSATEFEHLQAALFPSHNGEPDEATMSEPTANAAIMDEEADRLLLGADIAENLSPESFIKTYAHINVISNKSFARVWPAFQRTLSFETTIGLFSVRGNSRDDPSPYTYKCQKTPGCSQHR